MKKYIFQTGHAKGLARAEILAIIKDSSAETVVDEVFDGFVVEIPQIDDAKTLINRMGGIVRITEVIQSGPASMPINFVDWVVAGIEREVENKEAKVRFGLSMHPKSEKILKKILNDSKKNLKSKLGNIRYVNKDFQNLSSVQAWHSKLIGENSIELHIFKSEAKWYLTKTLAIQDFEKYSDRDYGRPNRSGKLGMLPPKLAQILVNLSNEETPIDQTTIFDPFCGLGTLLQEALLMGYKAQGSDIEADLIKKTGENIEWLEKELRTKFPKPTLFAKDATKLTSSDLPTEHFRIVTETWLGPTMEKAPQQTELTKIHREIETLYDAFFSNLKKIRKSPITIVFTAPFHKEGNERYFLENLPNILEKHGRIVPLSNHKRPSMFYERKQQFVGREIWKVII